MSPGSRRERPRPLPASEVSTLVGRALDGLPPDDAKRLIEISGRPCFRPGERICHEDDPAEALYLILQGRVAILVGSPQGQELTFSVMRPGEFFGELALVLPHGRRSATAQALEPVEVLSIRRHAFENLRAEHPAMNGILVTVLAGHVIRLSTRLRETLHLSKEECVRRRLLDLVEVYREDGAGPVTIPLRQEDVGSLAGANRALVNQVLRQEQEEGTVSLERGRITVLDHRRLRRRAGV